MSEKDRGESVEGMLSRILREGWGFGMWFGVWDSDGFVRPDPSQICVQINANIDPDEAWRQGLDGLSEPIGYSSGPSLQAVLSEAIEEAERWIENHPPEESEEDEDGC